MIEVVLLRNVEKKDMGKGQIMIKAWAKGAEELDKIWN